MCLHRRKVGDNYGETCLDCGEVLSGYGNFAEGSKDCHHKWWFDPEQKVWVCLYCERTTKVDPTMDN